MQLTEVNMSAAIATWKFTDC